MVHADLHPTRTDRIRVTAPYRHIPLVQTLPGVTRGKDDWTIPLSWTSALALKSTFLPADLTVDDELRAWIRTDHATRVLPSMALRDVVDLEAANLDVVKDPRAREIIEAARVLEQPTGRTRYPHQTAGAAFLAVSRRALLGDEQGAGKTTTVISALRLLHERGEQVFPALITGPNTTKIGWQREFDLVWPGHKVAVVKGTADQKHKILVEPADVYVMNWEALRVHSRLQAYGGVAMAKCLEHKGLDPKITAARCDVHPGELNDIEFKAVIGDEAHRVKEPATKVTRALKYASGDADIRFALTGTPIANAPDDLWSILNWLVPQEWPSRQAFVQTFCDESWDAAGFSKVVGIKAAKSKEFFASFDPRFRRMPKALVLPFLPPIVPEMRECEMSAKQHRAYWQMHDQTVAELEGELVLATNPMVKTLRLLQFASSYAEVIPPEEREVTAEDDAIKDAEAYQGGEVAEEHLAVRLRLTAPSCKIDAFLDDLDDFEGQSVVVFAVSRQLIELLSERLEKKKIDHRLIVGGMNEDQRQKSMDDFQGGKVQFVLCTTGAGGTGITLTKASTAVFLQRPWSAVENGQAEARVHRIGSEQHETITILDYVTTGTVEERVLETILAKDERLQEIVRDRQLLLKLLERAPEEKQQTVRKRTTPPPTAGTIPPITV